MNTKDPRPKLCYAESIADLWEDDQGRRKRPSTDTLFLAIAGEAEACLFRTNWEDRIRRIENILSVIKWRIRGFWEACHESEMDKLIRKSKEVT